MTCVVHPLAHRYGVFRAEGLALAEKNDQLVFHLDFAKKAVRSEAARHKSKFEIIDAF